MCPPLKSASQICSAPLTNGLLQWPAPHHTCFSTKLVVFPRAFVWNFPFVVHQCTHMLSVASANHTESSVSMRTQTEVLAKHHISVLEEYMVQKAPLSELVKHGVRQALINQWMNADYIKLSLCGWRLGLDAIQHPQMVPDRHHAVSCYCARGCDCWQTNTCKQTGALRRTEPNMQAGGLAKSILDPNSNALPHGNAPKPPYLAPKHRTSSFQGLTWEGAVATAHEARYRGSLKGKRALTSHNAWPCIARMRLEPMVVWDGTFSFTG